MTAQQETQQSGQKSGAGPIPGEGAGPCAASGEVCAEKHPYVNAAVEQTSKMLRTLSEKVLAVADTLRDQPGPRHRISRTVEKVGKRLESSASYLSSTEPDTMGDDLRGVVRQHPMRTLGVCFGAGLLLGAILRRRV